MNMGNQGEIIERLARIEEIVSGTREDVKAHIAEDHLIFHGDGSNDNKGLLIEHTQLMASHKTWRWIFGSVMSAVAAVLADVVIRGHF